MAEYPNDASRKSKAEGDRRSGSDAMDDRHTNEEAGGITNRPLDEEVSNQQSLPPRGESKRDAHATDADNDEQRSQR